MELHLNVIVDHVSTPALSPKNGSDLNGNDYTVARVRDGFEASWLAQRRTKRSPEVHVIHGSLFLNRIAAIRGCGPCNPDLARHGTGFIGNLAIGPHLGCELATCIANKRSPRVENNDIVTDHYAAGPPTIIIDRCFEPLFFLVSRPTLTLPGGRDWTYSPPSKKLKWKVYAKIYQVYV